jgi:hypothetical protein
VSGVLLAMLVGNDQQNASGDTASSISLPRPSGASSPALHESCVSPVARGADVGLVVLAGQELTVEILDTAINACQGDTLDDRGGQATLAPDGTGATSGTKFDENAIFPSAPVGSLIVRIGDGPWLLVEKTLILKAERDGWILFAYNNPPTEDTAGAIKVRIRIS